MINEKDIMRALENTSDGYGAGYIGSLSRDVIILIKRKNAEIERLKNAHREGLAQCKFDCLVKIAEYEQKLEDGELVSKEWHDEQVLSAENRIAEQNSEIERLMGYIYKYSEMMQHLQKLNSILKKQIAEQKAVIERLGWHDDT